MRRRCQAESKFRAMSRLSDSRCFRHRPTATRFRSPFSEVCVCRLSQQLCISTHRDVIYAGLFVSPFKCTHLNMPSALILIADGTEEMELSVFFSIISTYSPSTHLYLAPSRTIPSSEQVSSAPQPLCQMMSGLQTRVRSRKTRRLPKAPVASTFYLIHTSLLRPQLLWVAYGTCSAHTSTEIVRRTSTTYSSSLGVRRAPRPYPGTLRFSTSYASTSTPASS